MVFIPTDDGRWVNEHFERLARIVQDYDPVLQLCWIPPENRTRDDKKPYVIVDTRLNEPVVYASELDTPEEILTTLFMSDNKQGNVLTRIQAMETAQQLMQLKERSDMFEELHDKAKFLMQSPYHTVKMDGKTFDHNRRRIG